MNKTPSRIFVAARTAPRPHWDTYLKPPEATRASKPDSVAKEVEEKRAKRAAESHEIPFAATVTEFAACRAGGELVLELAAGASTPGTVSRDVLTWLNQQDNPYLVGIGVKLMLQIMRCDAIWFAAAQGSILSPPWAAGSIGDIPNLLYYPMFSAPRFYDPYEVLVPSERRGDVGLRELCNFMRLPCPDAAAPLREHAKLAAKLSALGGLPERL